MKKNEIITLSIVDVDGEGFGVGRVGNGLTVFVEAALPGDQLRARVLKVKSRFAYAKIVKILTPSPYRIPSPCSVSERCGGCQLQHCNYAAQLAFKKKMVENALIRIGGVDAPPVMDVIGMGDPFHYRHKGQFPVGANAKIIVESAAGGSKDLIAQSGNSAKRKQNTAAAVRENRNNTLIGFYAPRSHRIVPVTHCQIQHASHTRILEAVHEYIRENHIEPYDESTHQGLLRHVVIKAALSTNEIMAALVINSRRLKLPGEENLIKQLADAGAATILINANPARTNVILGDHSRILFGDGYIRERIGQILYRLSLRSFFQVNPLQTKILYDTASALGDFNGTETVIDAHTGVGGVALYIAGKVRYVYGTDIVPEAIADAKFNAAQNRINNARFITGAAEEAIPALLADNGICADAIFLDPPRKGCGRKLIDAIINAGIGKVIYISCDPATLARDVRLLAEGGYTLEKAQPVDMFPMTGKIESVCLLSKDLS